MKARTPIIVVAVIAAATSTAIGIAGGWTPVRSCQARAFTPLYLGGHQFAAHTQLRCSSPPVTLNAETCVQERGTRGAWHTKPAACTVLNVHRNGSGTACTAGAHPGSGIIAYGLRVRGRRGGVYRSWGWYYVNGVARVVVSSAWRDP